MNTLNHLHCVAALVCGGVLLAGSARAAELVPLELKLPAPAFKGTPKELPEGLDVEPLSETPRPPLMVPAGLANLAAGLVPSTSDTNAKPADLKKITDGDKDAYETSIVLLRRGVQHVTFDLGKPAELHALVVWHAHDAAKVYRCVVVQIADDAEFTRNVRTLFNNDTEDKAGQGAGKDRQYFETHEGKLIPAKGEKARFVRFWSRGSTESALNEYTEVEIWGKPAS